MLLKEVNYRVDMVIENWNVIVNKKSSKIAFITHGCNNKPIWIGRNLKTPNCSVCKEPIPKQLLLILKMETYD